MALAFCWRENYFLPYEVRLNERRLYDGYFEEDLEYERNGWAGDHHGFDCGDDWIGIEAAGEFVSAVKRLKFERRPNYEHG